MAARGALLGGAVMGAGLLFGFAAGAVAGEPVATSAEVRALIERLEAAEREIESLKRSALRTPAAPRRVRPAGATALPTPIPPLPPAVPPLSPFEERPHDFGTAWTAQHSDENEGATESAEGGTDSESESEANDRVQELSDQYDELSDQYDELVKQNEEFQERLEGFVLDGGPAVTMELSGRIHLDYWAFPDSDFDTAALEGLDIGDPLTPVNPQDRFTFRRIRFEIGGDIKDNMVYQMVMEFAEPNDFEIRDVYLGWTDLPILQTLLVGNQKRPYGLDHLNSSRYNVFIERPFIIEAVNEDARRLGIQSYGVSDDLRWNWRYGVFNLERLQDDGEYVGDHYQGEIAGRLANTYWWDEASDGRGYGHWAIAGTIADPDGNGGPQSENEGRFRTRPEARTTSRWLNTGRIDTAEQYEVLALEKVLNLGPLQLVGELQNVWLHRDVGTDLHFWGGYAYAAWFLTGEHMPWDREDGTLARPRPFENFFIVDECDGSVGSGWGAWQLAVRYSYADLSHADILGGVGSNWTFGLNWWWNPYAHLQFNFIRGHIDEQLVGNNPINADYSIVGTRFAVDF